MTHIICNNSSSKCVTFYRNGGRENDIHIHAKMYNEVENCFEFWFTIGNGYSSLNRAKKAAQREMAKFGYTFDEAELKALTF